MYLPENILFFHSSEVSSQQVAGKLTTIPLILSTLLSPALGLYLDHFGQRMNVILFSMVTLNVGLLIFKNHLIASLILIGIEFGAFSTTLWPTLAFCLNEKNLGFGLGVISCLTNLGFVLDGSFFGYVRGNFGEEGVMHTLIL